MSLSREQILEYASPYVEQSEVFEFPMGGDLFCIMAREVPPDRELREHEGWQFGGYGVCRGYRLDTESKPEGKWLWFEFVSLMSFPPQPATLKLQPPHVVRGSFHSPDRSQEFKVLRIELDADTLEAYAALAREVPESKEPERAAPANIIAFPRRRRRT